MAKVGSSGDNFNLFAIIKDMKHAVASLSFIPITLRLTRRKLEFKNYFVMLINLLLHYAGLFKSFSIYRKLSNN